MHLTWVESHDTALGAPDVQYAIDGVEGWLELKAGPGIDVRASQVRWMEDHIEAGGCPLFLIKSERCFIVVPGSRAAALRQDPSHESILHQSSCFWCGELDYCGLINVLKNPRKEYDDTE